MSKRSILNRLPAPLLGLGALVSTLAMSSSASASDSSAPAGDPGTAHATFGGGCFWCIEAVFETVPGVKSVISGYAGGDVPNPSYEEVRAGGTGHAEVVRIEFDPAQVSYEKLLDLFWEAHNPTTRNRQGADVGEQYRSIILYENEEQHQIAERSKAAAQTKFDRPIVTEIVPLKKFYPAEEHHQDYFARNKHAPYCSFVIAPKLKKLGRDSGPKPIE